MILNLYLIQQTVDSESSLIPSVILVIACLVLLLGLWLPDIITKD